MEIHMIEPVFDEKSEILILGSFPSVKSREEMFFYANKQNRFWKVLAAVLDKKEPKSVDEKKEFLSTSKIALWDVAAECEIVKSSDVSIKNIKPNDINIILEKADIKTIYINGRAAEKYYNRYFKKNIAVKAVYLPSTSPANAAYSLKRLIGEWSVILQKQDDAHGRNALQ